MRCAKIAVATTLAAAGFWMQSGGAALAFDDCSTANAEICINVGETAKIKVTNKLLQTFCVDSNGKPDDELVEPYVTGYPTTGRAGVTFKPVEFRAYSGFSTLSINTTIETRPGNYALIIGATGERCGNYNTHRTLLLVRPKIGGAGSLWSFGGAKPPGYPTEAVLIAFPEDRPPYKWFAIGSTNWLRLPNGQSSITTNVNRVKVTALRPNPVRGNASITVGMGDALSPPHKIDVRTPAVLDLRGGTHAADPNRGYRSTWRYEARDQFERLLPTNLLPLEIVWTTGQFELLSGNNWVRSPSGQKVRVNPRDIAFALVPRTEGGWPVNVGVPRPQEPNRGRIKVDCWRAAIFLGGDDIFRGVRVDTQNWVRYRDHGTTEGSKCP